MYHLIIIITFLVLLLYYPILYFQLYFLIKWYSYCSSSSSLCFLLCYSQREPTPFNVMCSPYFLFTLGGMIDLPKYKEQKLMLHVVLFA